jgi:SAM-dependent methyltransferase
LPDHEVKGKNVVEVGSFDVNGSVRESLLAYDPASYVGVDISPGPNVDVVWDATKLLDKFAPRSFDVVLSTEMIEHVRDWRAALDGMKRLCKPSGVVVITTRSPGFGYHGYPHDFWRYTLSDMALIFADFDIDLLEPDPDASQQGVFLKARSSGAEPIDLDPIALTSILTDRRETALTEYQIRRFQILRQINLAVKPVSRLVPQQLKAPLKKRLGIGPGF